jgi:hypothetical protein
MGDLLRQGSQWLAGVLKQHASSPVIYSRPPADEEDDTVELEIAATLGKTDYEKLDQYGIPVGAQATDFLVSAADFTATFGEPQVGDRVVADGAVYEVLELPGQGCWRWSDGFGNTMRIHTKRIGDE